MCGAASVGPTAHLTSVTQQRTARHGVRAQAEVFQKKGRSLRNKMWWNYCKWKLLIAGAIILLAIVIFLIACFSGGRDCTARPEDLKPNDPKQ